VTLLVGLAVAALAVAAAGIARRSRVPPPVYLVLAGLVVSFVPRVERFHLPPQVVFYGFLPPLVYAAAFVTAPREARANWRFILVLAFGLTAATLFAVGLVGWAALPALGAGGAFVLGAVLGPTDPVSATSVLGHTSAPERLRTILEGESLVNDGVGLVAFSIALTAVEHGSFSALDGIVKFLYVSAGGIAFGIVVAWLVERIRVRVHDAELEISLSLLTPYVAYIPADKLHLSGILATVACGIYLGWRSGGIFKPEVRLQSVAFWNVLTFALTSVLFVLLGTQFRGVVHSASGRLILDPLLIFGVLTMVRLLWMLTAVRDTLRDRFVLGWSGMRGALSLAAALSIPVAVAQRNQILYLTFTTILAGLVVLAIPLPWLLDTLGFEAGGADETAARERLRELAAPLDRRRAELARMEQSGEVSHAAARRIELDLDLEETILSRR
jgi:Na+/H+ antiporter